MEVQYINQNFSCIPKLIKDIEKDTYDTQDFLVEIRMMWKKLNEVPNINEKITDHFAKVFLRNKGYTTISNFYDKAGL